MNSDKIAQAANRLLEASKTGVFCAPIRELIGSSDVETAYAVQDINTKRRLNAGAKIVGSKIGLTSEVVQQQLGVDQPDFGILFDDMEVKDGQEMDSKSLTQPKVEAEIAFVLKSGLSDPQITTSEVIEAIDYCVAAIEIVGSRITGWDIKITDTIADNASASHFVLGNEQVNLDRADLVNCKMEMSVNGVKSSEGKGSACMGSPINAVLWLAKTMAQMGRPLKSGDVILSGALGPMAPIHPGDVAECQIEGIGSVSVKFSNG